MITVATSTFCRPDLVQLLADALSVTLKEPYEFAVVVQPGGLRREWRNVHRVIDGVMTGYRASNEVIHGIQPPFVYLHDDCIPVLPWTTAIFPHIHSCRREAPTVEYHARKYAHPLGKIPVSRIRSAEDAPESWGDLRSLASECSVESLSDGVFLHIDKGTTAPLNDGDSKRQLVEAIAAHLGIPAPEPLTDEESEFISSLQPRSTAFSGVTARWSGDPQPEPKPDPNGPGAILKGILSWLKVKVTPDCPCMAFAAQMDEWGPDGCLERMGVILDHLQKQAEARKLLFSRTIAERAVRIAIWRARRAAGQ